MLPQIWGDPSVADRNYASLVGAMMARCASIENDILADY
jgi:hypothetical protein